MDKQLNIKLFLILLVSSSWVSAQQDRKGSGWDDHVVCASIGYGFYNADVIRLKMNAEDSGVSLSDIKNELTVHGKCEFALSDRLGLGLSLNYSETSFMEKITNTNKNTGIKVTSEKLRTINVFTALLRLNYHFLVNKTSDLYLGAGVGPRIEKVNFEEAQYPYLSYSERHIPGLEVTLGFRHHFGGVLGVYAECGISRALLQVGLSVRLK